MTKTRKKSRSKITIDQLAEVLALSNYIDHGLPQLEWPTNFNRAELESYRKRASYIKRRLGI